MAYRAHNRDRPSPMHPPAARVCFGLTPGGACTAQPTDEGFCAAHQEQAMWLHPTAARISAAARRAHAEDRRCCGLTKKYALCRNNPGGNFAFCWLHGRQRPLPNVGAAAGPEPPQTAVVRERMREFERIRRESEAREYEARDRWAREEQRRREQERARAEREQEERQRQREQQWRQYQEQEQRRQQEERERREQQQRQEESHRQWQRSYQRQRRYGARNAEGSARPSADEQRRRDQQQEQARRAEAEREQREQARRATEDQLRARILQHYLDASAEFDQTIFSAQNPNHFARVPWPVFPRPDSTVRPGDVTRENVLRFFDVSRMRRFTDKTAREIDVILKNTARRFHPDRFSVNRAIVGSIRDLQDRNAVIQAAEIVIQTVNGLRGG